MTRLGTEADAAPLITYLDRYLLRPDLDYDQHAALGALLCIDETLGTDHTARLIQPGGLWWRWCDALSAGARLRSPQDAQWFIGQLRALAMESGRAARSARE